jgi:hypothetical protein
MELEAMKARVCGQHSSSQCNTRSLHRRTQDTVLRYLKARLRLVARSVGARQYACSRQHLCLLLFRHGRLALRRRRHEGVLHWLFCPAPRAPIFPQRKARPRLGQGQRQA